MEKTGKKTKIIVVLGMHRSGTSAITHAMQALGVELGEKLNPAAAGVNGKGFWEDLDIVSLNDKMLASLGYQWCTLRSLQKEDADFLCSRGYLTEAIRLIRKKSAGLDLYGFKDPRVAKMILFWTRVFEAGDFDVWYVLAVRNPLSVALSLEKRDGFPIELSYLLWLDHVIGSLSNIGRRSVVVVDYDELMLSPERELRRICDWFEGIWDQKKISDYCHDFLEETLRHSCFSAQDVYTDTAAPQLMCEVYKFVLDVLSGRQTIQAGAESGLFRKWEAELVRLRPVFGLVERQQNDIHVNHIVLAERAKEIDTLSGRLSKCESEVAAYVAAVAERDAQISAYTATIAENEDRRTALDAQQDAERELLAETLAQQSAQIKKDQAHFIRNQKALEQAQQQLGSLKTALDARSAEVADLGRRLEMFQTSRLWRALKPVRKAISEARRARNVLRRVYAKKKSVLIKYTTATDNPICPPELFDKEWYTRSYPDVSAAGLEPWKHFLEFGLKEGRDPNAHFDSSWYLTYHHDVGRDANANALLHYLRYGAAEGRNPHPSFDAAFYISMHADAAQNPLLHYMRIGRSQNWPTARIIDIEKYLPSVLPPFETPSDVKVDIVIPVYRGLDETRRCLETVIADRSRPMGEILVIDDCSPEPELSLWLDGLAANGSIKLLRNERNLGFVQTVNRGMDAAGRHDVVLLNSDTEVPEGWLRRMAAQAYSQPKIGSVTPFSNNATICSYPAIGGWELPAAFSLEELDAAAAHANAGRNVEIPTAVGFAMYIRRDCLDDVGLFDAETFGLGYGEENDFSLRASSRGWLNILACDTFVYHAGEVSFGKVSPSRDRAFGLISSRYPYYPELVSTHIRRDEAAAYRFALTARLFRDSGRPVILLITHALGGGTERHVQDLIQQTAGQVEYLVLRPVSDECVLSVPSLPSHPTLQLSNERLQDLADVLISFGVKRVHVHHLFGLNIDVQTLLRLVGAPFDFTVHDYYTICPRINLISFVDGHWRYCNEARLADCNSCLVQEPRSRSNDIVTWRWKHRWLFVEADRVICPSQDIVDRLTRFGLASHCVVVPHEAVTSSEWRVTPRIPAAGSPLRIGILGTLAPNKGRALVRACVMAAPPGKFEFVLIGQSEPSIELPNNAPFRETGRYQEDELQGLIAKEGLHVIWFPAAWPETYSYTLSAALASHLPIIAIELGAFPERIEGRPLSWLLPSDAGTSAWLQLFETVRTSLEACSDPHLVGERSQNIAFYPDSYLQPLLQTAQPDAEGVNDIRRAGRISVLVIPEVMSNGEFSPCAHIRLLLPLDRLGLTENVDFTVVTADAALSYRADMVISHRYAVGDMSEAEQLIAHCRRFDMQLCYDLDDNLLAISEDHPEFEILSHRASVVECLVRAADSVWTSTEPLQTELREFSNNVLVIKNGLEEKLFSVTDKKKPGPDDQIRILYMGTMTHEQDFLMIEPVLQKLVDDFGEHISIEIIGVTARSQLPQGIRRVDVPPSASTSYPAFMTWLTAQDRWHIGIAPLVDTHFNRSKSSIKTLDYMALGLATVVSDVAAYKPAPETAVVKVGNDPDLWYSTLRALILDLVQLEKISDAGRAYLKVEGTLSAQYEARRAIWTKVTGVGAIT